MHSTRTLLPSFALAACCAPFAAAQCDPVLTTHGTFDGANGNVQTLTRWDPDGAGPLGEHLVVGGAFTIIGSLQTSGLALYEPVSQSWSLLGNCAGEVLVSAVDQNGNLLVGGDFTSIDGVPAANLARFDGTSWSAVGAANTLASGPVYAIEPHPSGNLYVGGDFSITLPGGSLGNSIACFDGTTWTAIGNLGGGWADDAVKDLATLANGDLVATGFFVQAGALPTQSIARWDGTAWHAFGAGLELASPVQWGQGSSLAIAANGDLVVAGRFDAVDGVACDGIARWNGATWQAVGTPAAGLKRVVFAASSGDLILGGLFESRFIESTRAQRWDGSSWHVMDSSFPAPKPALCFAELPSGDLMAGTQAESARDGTSGLEVWNSTSWQPLAPGTDGPVTTGIALANGDYFVSGAVTSVAGTPTWAAAFLTNGQWQAAPAVNYLLNIQHRALELRDGSIVVIASDPLVSQVAHYNGTAWTILGAFAGRVDAVAEDADGSIVVGGIFPGSSNTNYVNVPRLARWDGNQWSAVDADFTGTISALTLLADGRMAFGGNLSSSTAGQIGHLATFDGQTWTTIGGDIDAAPRDLEVLSNGDLVAIGDITLAGTTPLLGIARFDGTTWHGLGNGFPPGDPSERPTRLAALPDRGLLVGGKFTMAGAVPANNVARWHDGVWAPIGSGANGTVQDLDAAADGRVIVVGEFHNFDGQDSMFLVTIEPPCAATATIYGGGTCSAAYPAPELSIEAGAWLGGTLRTSAGNLPSNAVALSTFGTTIANLHLPTLLPQGVASCYLLLQPDVLQLQVPNNGVTTTSLPIPNTSSLVGLQLLHQYIGIEFSPQTTISAVSSSDGVQFTIGTW